jgi:hypothetical protein
VFSRLLSAVKSWRLVASEYSAESRDTIGGHPLLKAGRTWPRCHCGERMVLFFQLDVHAKYGLPFVDGSHLLAFMCWQHNDAAPSFMGRGLPRDYWDLAEGAFFRFLLDRPGPSRFADEPEPRLAARTLVPSELDDAALDCVEFKIGGKPDWAQRAELHACGCGAPMAFLCQLPENHEFDSTPGQPPQPGMYMSEELREVLATEPFQRWSLFLGNGVYVTACTAQCRPEAVWPVCQN